MPRHGGQGAPRAAEPQNGAGVARAIVRLQPDRALARRDRPPLREGAVRKDDVAAVRGAAVHRRAPPPRRARRGRPAGRGGGQPAVRQPLQGARRVLHPLAHPPPPHRRDGVSHRAAPHPRRRRRRHQAALGVHAARPQPRGAQDRLVQADVPGSFAQEARARGRAHRRVRRPTRGAPIQERHRAPRRRHRRRGVGAPRGQADRPGADPQPRRGRRALPHAHHRRPRRAAVRRARDRAEDLFDDGRPLPARDRRREDARCDGTRLRHSARPTPPPHPTLLPLQASPTSSSSPSSARRSSTPRPSTSARTRTGRRRR